MAHYTIVVSGLRNKIIRNFTWRNESCYSIDFFLFYTTISRALLIQRKSIKTISVICLKESYNI